MFNPKISDEAIFEIADAIHSYRLVNLKLAEYFRF